MIRGVWVKAVCISKGKTKGSSIEVHKAVCSWRVLIISACYVILICTLTASFISLASWYAGGLINAMIRRSNLPVSSYFRSSIRSWKREIVVCMHSSQSLLFSMPWYADSVVVWAWKCCSIVLSCLRNSEAYFLMQQVSILENNP